MLHTQLRDASDAIAELVFVGTTDRVSDQITEHVSVGIADHIPYGIAVRVSDGITGQVSEGITDRVSYRITEHISYGITDANGILTGGANGPEPHHPLPDPAIVSAYTFRGHSQHPGLWRVPPRGTWSFWTRRPAHARVTAPWLPFERHRPDVSPRLWATGFLARPPPK